MQKLQLSIPEPCHENWQQMTPTQQGRFCNACAKEVVDFSMMTDTEVLNYFTKLTHEKVCGRALPSQLERTITMPKEPKKKLFWYWNYIVMFFMFFKGNNASAQTCTKPAMELSPVKNPDVRGQMIKIGEVKQDDRQEVIGKVVDEQGLPVQFATISVKGQKIGVSTNSKGEFNINTELNSILIISAVGFSNTDVPVAMRREMKIILKSGFEGVLGGAMLVSQVVKNGIYSSPDNQRLVGILTVKDFEKNTPISDATIIITKNNADKSEIFSSNVKGKYKMKGIKAKERYDILIKADGYEPNEFTIVARDFENRKREWEVLLRKQKPATVKSTATAKIGKETSIRLGQVTAHRVIGNALYVVDGIIMPGNVDINPDDIEDITILQTTQAMAIYGTAASNGAIVITTRQTKIKSLDTVAITAYPVVGKLKKVSTTRTTSVMGGMVSGQTIQMQNTIIDSLKTITTTITGAIKIYPNPVQRGSEFSVRLKLKQPGNNYNMLITDAAGRVLLQQKFNAASKDYTQRITGDSRWAAGIYYIRVFDARNKLISKSSLVFK